MAIVNSYGGIVSERRLKVHDLRVIRKDGGWAWRCQCNGFITMEGPRCDAREGAEESAQQHLGELR